MKLEATYLVSMAVEKEIYQLNTKKKSERKLMKRSLIDAGPMIALFDKDDQYHIKIMDLIESYQGELFTTWPVVTETVYMLDFNQAVQIDFLTWIKRGAVEIIDLNNSDLVRIIELAKKYSDVPMDLADATLIVASEELNIENIISIDPDFYIYRNIPEEYLRNIFKE